jgi:hypothetical protein
MVGMLHRETMFFGSHDEFDASTLPLLSKEHDAD